MGPSHTKSRPWGGDIKNYRAEVCKAIRRNGLTCSDRLQVVNTTGSSLSAQHGGFEPTCRLCPKGLGLVKLLGIPRSDCNCEAGSTDQGQQCHRSMMHIGKSVRQPSELENKSVLARRGGQQAFQPFFKLTRRALQITLDPAKFSVDFALQFLHP